jgi:hypothetical protein
MKFENSGLKTEIYSYWSVSEDDEFYKLKFGSVIQ